MKISLRKYKGIIIAITIAFSILLIVDILLGFEASEEKVEYRIYFQQRTGYLHHSRIKTIVGLETDENIYILKEPLIYNKSRKGDEVLIYKSKLLGEIGKIRHKNIDYNDSAYSIYSFYKLFPFIFIISSFCATICYRFRIPYLDFFLTLSSIMALYLVISIFTNNMV